MRKTIVALAILATATTVMGMYVLEQVNLEAMCGSVTLTAGTVTNMIPSASRMAKPKVYNFCNEEQSVYDIRCGYEVSLSTIAGSAYLGFKIPPGECRYRAVGGDITPYCTPAIVSGTLEMTREAYR